MNDDFDDMLRSRLQQSEPTPSSDAHSVLGQLQPAMRRARIRRTVAIGTATLSLLGISGIGLAAVTTSLRQESSELDILIEGDRLPAPSPETSAPAPNIVEQVEDSSSEAQAELEVSSTSIPTAATTIPPGSLSMCPARGKHNCPITATMTALPGTAAA